MTPRELHDALSCAEVTDLFTARGTHEGCGGCCSRFLPITAAEAVRLRAVAKRVGVMPEREDVIDLSCPLLDASRRCMAYGERPDICRAYDCAKHKRLGPLAPAMRLDARKRYEVRDMREVVA